MTSFAPGTLHRVTRWFATYRTPTAMLGSVIEVGTVFMILSEEIVVYNDMCNMYAKAYYCCLSSDGTIWHRSWPAGAPFQLYQPKTGNSSYTKPLETS